MDGSTSTFLADDLFISARQPGAKGGILYIEDFGLDPCSPPRPAEEAPPPEPVYRAADLDAARLAGREEGAQAALADAHLLQTQLQSAASQALAEGLAAARATLQTIAQAHATDLTHEVLAVLQAALPATMRAHADTEMRAMLAALMPGLVSEPELRVRAHADMADSVREALIAAMPEQTCVLSVFADPALAPGDVLLSWQNGHARRDTASIWAQIRTALAPLALPAIEELCRGH